MERLPPLSSFPWNDEDKESDPKPIHLPSLESERIRVIVEPVTKTPHNLVYEEAEEPQNDPKRRKNDTHSEDEEKSIPSEVTHSIIVQNIVCRPTDTDYRVMDYLSITETRGWKRVLYNLLVENHNSQDKKTLLNPCNVVMQGITRGGFYFNASLNPEQRLPELYSVHVKHIDLTKLDSKNPSLEGYYKKYWRAALQFISKYFGKACEWTYVYGDVPLFIPNEDVADAEKRLKLIKSRHKGSAK
eukprot:TRINITY_DN11731_c0_g1_i1.p1 TRINITY_DN11731_c0_g1~~TRINITY_DN11731_c0_g1_i1.p1  ORF type:complete len:273 (+),score=36.13 TRINITY_DN11731_c0_g1_i1:89-820(+)